MTSGKWRLHASAAAALVAGGAVQAGEAAAPAATLKPSVVTATRLEQDAFDLPASADRIDAGTLVQAGPGINLSEALARVPGIAALNRQNYAQDLQIQSRGFGARSTFGVRGVRLLADGIPATMPDGQGQSSGFALGSAQRIEVLRGPFSALWGNASGGVIQVFTADGGARPEATVSQYLGSDGLRKTALKVGGTAGAVNLLFDLSHFETEGWRAHGAAQRSQLNGKLRWKPDADARLTLVLNVLEMPQVQDPLGLTAQQLRADPRQAGDNALRYDTRKTIRNRHAGVVYERQMGRDELRLMSYAGTRDIVQFQAIPSTAQDAATSPGGVIGLGRRYGGLDARYTLRGELAARPATLSFGANLDQMQEVRRGWLNFSGTPAAPTATGVQGALRRDERNRASNADQYLQGEWEAAARWTLSAGLRHSSVRVRSQDRHLANGDDSGHAHYDALTPVLGAVFHAAEDWNVYASYGRSFETPTLNELAYRADGGAGLNTGLAASKGRHFELGVKARMDEAWLVNAALFHARTRNEIGVFTNSGGRSAFQDVGATRRSGAELAAQWKPVPQWTLYAALTLLNASYLDGFRSCTAAPCTAGSAANTTPVPPGSRIPGTARRTAYAELAWQPVRGLQTALELRHSSRIYADDLNTQAAAGWSTWAWRAAWERPLGGWMLTGLLRVDNLADRRYVGSVIVNEANRRYFEPAAGRNWTLGMQAGRRF